MFVGHYGPAGALAGERVKLWHAVVAVQLLDILWAPLVLAGVEKVRIVENFTASNHFDLYHMPWTHSLPMALFWSILAGMLFVMFRRKAGITGGVVIGILVFSHWVLDLLTHKPDLELWFGGAKVGFGLWENRPLSVGVELGLFFVGMGFYLNHTSPRGIAGRIAMAAFIAIGASLQIYHNWSPPPPTPEAAIGSAFVVYWLFALLALWVDATRTLKLPAPSSSPPIDFRK